MKQDKGNVKKCFMNSVKPPRNPRARANAKDAILSAITGCSEKYLSPVYDQCTALLKDKTGEKKGVKECYIRALVTELVQTCSNGVNEATAESMKNATPKMLEKIGKIFGDDDGDDDDEE